MRSKKLTVLCGLAMAGLGQFAGKVKAAPMPTYSYVATLSGSSTQINGITLTQGGASQTIAIYLYEQNGSLISGDGGLYSGAFSMAETAGASPAQLTSALGYTTNFPGGTTGEAGSGDSVMLRRIFDDSSATVAQNGTGGATPVGGLIELGTVTIAPGAGPGTTTFKIWDYDQTTNKTTISNNGWTQTAGNTDYFLDERAVDNGNIFSGAADNPTTFTVTTTSSASPEPASLALFGLGGITLLARRRKQV